MTDWVPDTPTFGRRYCPVCEPDADPIEEILEVSYCPDHYRTVEGSEDDAVSRGEYMSGAAEAGGEPNKRWCDIIHRRNE